MIEGTNDDDATIYGEPNNNEFLPPARQQDGAIGVTIEHEGVLYVQYCHYGDVYYQSSEIYGNDSAKMEEAIDRMAHFSKLWSICVNAPSFQDFFLLRLCFEMEYDQRMIEINQQLIYQGVLVNCMDVVITEAELQETQAPLNPSVRRPGMEDWKKKRKYLGNIPVNIVQHALKHTTQIGTLSPSTHLKRQFKSPNPAFNLHCQNEANATDQFFCKGTYFGWGKLFDKPISSTFNIIKLVSIPIIL